MPRSACCCIYDIATGAAGQVCGVMHCACIVIAHDLGGLCTLIYCILCQVYEVKSAADMNRLLNVVENKF